MPRHNPATDLYNRLRAYFDAHPEVTYRSFDRTAGLGNGYTAAFIKRRRKYPGRLAVSKLRKALDRIAPETRTTGADGVKPIHPQTFAYIKMMPSRRDMFAAAALEGMMSGGLLKGIVFPILLRLSGRSYADLAAEYADDLIDELDQE